MKSNLSDLTASQLVERFIAVALDQDDALLDGRYGKYNRLYDGLEDIAEELKRRSGDQRRALLPLLEHLNAQVRLKASIATLAISPDLARHTLQSISDRNEYPQAAEARGMISAIKEGRYIPT